MRIGTGLLALFLALAFTMDAPPQSEARNRDKEAAVVATVILGAIALAAASHDHRHKHHKKARHIDRPGSGVNAPFSPHRNVTCFPAQRTCYRASGRFAGKWTNKVFGG